MAESDTSLTQRVESLERTSHERVVEQVADLGERVAGLESARDAENPHLATKADIARMETQIEHTQELIGQLDKKIDARYDQLDEKIDARYDQLDKKIDEQSDVYQSKLDAQSELLQKILEQRINRQTAWMLATFIALAALMLSRLPA